MSVTSLADEEVAKAQRLQIRMPYPAGIGRSGTVASPPEGPSPTVLDALSRYIPTEIITLYLAALSAMPALVATFAFVNDVRLYWSFVALTPLLLVLVLAGKRRRAGLSAFPPLRQWPLWKLVASTISFLVWALAVPTAPYLEGPAGKIVAAFAALLVSTFLTLLEPILEPRDTNPKIPSPPHQDQELTR